MIFEKEGFSRNLIADDEQIFIYDFCMFYVFNQRDYELLGKWQLGNDLSSDICGMAVDNPIPVQKLLCGIKIH